MCTCAHVCERKERERGGEEDRGLGWEGFLILTMRKHVECTGDHPCPPSRVILVSLPSFVETQREGQITSKYVCAYSLSRVQLFFDPMDCSPASLLCGISQARILEWVAIFFFRGSS